MKDEQKLRLLRSAVSFASDFYEAKRYTSFICGFKEPFATRTPSEKEGNGGYEDGVYLVDDGFIPVRLGDVAGVQSPNSTNVMVSYHGHKWIVAKEDIGDDRLPLLSEDAHSKKTSPLYKNEIEALNDFDMKSCTEHLRKVGLAFEMDADLYIPTVGQLAAMFLYRKELNKALEMVGGTTMKKNVYWSSSEVSANYSWGVGFHDGGVLGSNEYDGYYVRPCTAFEL